jgi:hypothetical protein
MCFIFKPLQQPIMIFPILSLLNLLFVSVRGCNNLELRSSILGVRRFEALSAQEIREAGFVSGRAVYKQYGDDTQVLYIYHALIEPSADGNARWIINDILGKTDSAIAFVDSYAVVPTLIHAVNDHPNQEWSVISENGFAKDSSFRLFCTDNVPDKTAYFEAVGFPSYLSGFYVQVLDHEGAIPVFQHVRADNDFQAYLYKLDAMWVIGENIGARDGVAFVHDDAEAPSMITSGDWSFSVQGSWHQSVAFFIAGDEEMNVYGRLRVNRRVSALPNSQTFFEFKNGLSFPTLGLGTGGIPLDSASDIIKQALHIGYRMFDLAREYGTEKVMGDLLASSSPEDGVPFRNEMFITTKVYIFSTNIYSSHQ